MSEEEGRAFFSSLPPLFVAIGAHLCGFPCHLSPLQGREEEVSKRGLARRIVARRKKKTTTGSEQTAAGTCDDVDRKRRRRNQQEAKK